jgi:CRISPR/Cas system-associated endoribonuclease Cas2
VVRSRASAEQKFKEDTMWLRMIVYLNKERSQKTVHRGPFTEDECKRIVAKWEAVGKESRVCVGLYKLHNPERDTLDRIQGMYLLKQLDSML